MPHVHDRLLRISEAALFLAVSRSSIYQLMEHGQLPYVKVGRARRVRQQDLDQFVLARLIGARIEIQAR